MSTALPVEKAVKPSAALALDPSQMPAYIEEDRLLRVRHAKLGCYLALVLMPAGASLDLFVYPKLMGTIFIGRMLTDVFILPLLVALFTDFGRRWIRVIGVLWPLLPGVAISWMIAISQGTASTYYAGLNLVIIIACTLMPYTWKDSVVVCAITLVMFLGGCGLHHFVWFPDDPWRFSDLYNSLYFIVLTGIITTAASWYFSRRRVEDFRLRHRLDEQNHQINESYRKLEELDRLRSQFFANISHELRTPLTLILAPIEDLLRRETALPDRVAEPLGVARQNALRLLKLINDLLELVRLDERNKQQRTPQAGMLAPADRHGGMSPGSGTSLRMDVLDLAGFASGVGESIRYLAEAKGLTLVCKADPLPSVGDASGAALGPVRLPVTGDPSRLEKVLLNLLNNAVKFTPTGGTITIRWRAEGALAVVEVVDTGVGIPAAELPRIFDRFRQVDGSTTRQYQGAGIGLSLVKELTEEHGGTVTATSTVGQGTILRVALPLVATNEDLLVGPKTEPGDVLANIYRSAERRGGVTLDEGTLPEELPAEGGNGPVVLVVDDEPDMRRYLVSRLIERAPDAATAYRVYQSGDGNRAVELAKRVRPDLMVLDLMLPGIDGLEVCRLIRAEPSLADTRIILLTARMDEETKFKGLSAGADDFLTKPFSTPELRLRVATHLRTQTLQQELRVRGDELSKAMDRLKATESQLVHSEKLNAMGVLSAGLLHEINNPLNYSMSALGAARSLLPKDRGDLKEMLTDTHNGLDRMRVLVKDLGLFAHKHQDAIQEEVGLAATVALAGRLCSHELKEVQVTQDIPADLTTRGSAIQLSQVFVNLFTNAAKAMVNQKGATLRISARRQGQRMHIEVADSGSGIAPENLSRIFDPFFTTREPGSGLGLGLSITHTIVTSHGGSISVASTVGAGTTFTLDLPANP